MYNIYITLANLHVIHFYTVCYFITIKIVKFIAYNVDNNMNFILCFLIVIFPCVQKLFIKYLCLIIT